jgi:hypothetical protein
MNVKGNSQTIHPNLESSAWKDRYLIVKVPFASNFVIDICIYFIS